MKGLGIIIIGFIALGMLTNSLDIALWVYVGAIMIGVVYGCIRGYNQTKEAKIERINRKFEESIKSDMEKIEKSVQECIVNAGIKNTDIELVILTGGSTEIPYVSRVMRSYFPNAELSSANKMASVGLGLAYDAMRRFAEPHIENNIIPVNSL